MFPIIFGHHAIAVGATVLYAPFYYQTIAAYSYLILCIILIIVNRFKLDRISVFLWSSININLFSYVRYKYFFADVSFNRIWNS